MNSKHFVSSLAVVLLAAGTALAGDASRSKTYSIGNTKLGASLVATQQLHYGTVGSRTVDDRFQANFKLFGNSLNNAAAAHVRGQIPGVTHANVDLFGATVWQANYTGTASHNTPDISVSVFGPTGVGGTYPLGPFNITARANLGARADLLFSHEVTGTTAIKVSGGPRGWGYATGSVSVGIWIAGFGMSTAFDFAQLSFAGYAKATTTGYTLASSLAFDPYHLKVRFYVEWCGWFECVDIYETDLVDVSGPTYTFPLL